VNQDEVLMRKFLRKKSFGEHNPFWEARTRIFAWYVGISAVLVGLSIPVFTQLAVIQVDNRVREDLEEEIEAFEKSFSENAEKEITTIFDRFLKYKIPGDKTFLITTINGYFYRSSPISLPQAIAPRSSLIQKLAKTTQNIRGEEPIKDEQVGDIIYKAKPVVIDEQIRGVLIVANIARGERREILSAILVVIQVLLVALLLALIFAWRIAKEVLRPINTLTNTAKIITETDLTQRIPVQGSGEMAELAKTFNNMMNRIETAFVSQRQLLNDASHELRTPITIIRGHLELLDVDNPQDITEAIDLVIDELDRMGRFVEDLLLLAKAERRDFLLLKPLYLNELTEEMYRIMQGLGERKWQLENQALGIAILDRQRIIQAMMNLAHNAVKYTEPIDTITLGSAIVLGKIHFWIQDTGIGIPPEDQQRIFDRFVRANNNQTNNEGTGLGLSIVSAIAQSHKGRVELYSKGGQGSKSTLVLPFNS
jgi:signal transduction histidine kinase